jgi:hypothetical protein
MRRDEKFGRMPPNIRQNAAKYRKTELHLCRVVYVVCRFYQLIDHQLKKTVTLHVRPNISLQLPTVDSTQG